MNVGDFIYVKNTHKAFGEGEWVYELIEVGVSCPHDRFKENDGMKFKLLGGKGFGVVIGREIIDCEKYVNQNLVDGITKVVSKEEANKIVEGFNVKEDEQ